MEVELRRSDQATNGVVQWEKYIKSSFVSNLNFHCTFGA